jgi:quercetin dioxygenase-like cupin family protein
MAETLNIIEKTNKIFVKNLKRDYEYQSESILIKTISKGSTGSIVLFILDKDQGLIEHSASSDAIVYVLEGRIEFSISGQNYCLSEGNVLRLPAEIPHSFTASEKSKMLLIILL